jgi:hypothetical protein
MILLQTFDEAQDGMDVPLFRKMYSTYWIWGSLPIYMRKEVGAYLPIDKEV